MKGLAIWLECLAAAAVVLFSLSDGWWHTTIGYLLSIVILAIIFLCFILYGFKMGTDDVSKARRDSYNLGFDAGKRQRW